MFFNKFTYKVSKLNFFKLSLVFVLGISFIAKAKTTINQYYNSSLTIQDSIQSEVKVTADSLQGFYYLEDGTFLGKMGNRDEVLLTDSSTYNTLLAQDSVFISSVINISEIYNISHSDFLNRVNWTYGEGGGMAAVFYASTINNMAKEFGEHKMYKFLNEGEKDSAANNKRKYFVDYDGSNTNYKRFRRYRQFILSDSKKNKISKEDMKFLRESSRANLDVIRGVTNDVTEGATNKSGGKRAIAYAQYRNAPEQKMYVVEVTNSVSKYKSYHIFYKLAQRQESKQGYTLVKMIDFEVVSTDDILGDKGSHPLHKQQ